jgi:hypothetical protein
MPLVRQFGLDFFPGKATLQAPPKTKFLRASMHISRLILQGLVFADGEPDIDYDVYCLLDNQHADVSSDDFAGTVEVAEEIFSVFVVHPAPSPNSVA